MEDHEFEKSLRLMREATQAAVPGNLQDQVMRRVRQRQGATQAGVLEGLATVLLRGPALSSLLALALVLGTGTSALVSRDARQALGARDRAVNALGFQSLIHAHTLVISEHPAQTASAPGPTQNHQH